MTPEDISQVTVAQVGSPVNETTSCCLVAINEARDQAANYKDSSGLLMPNNSGLAGGRNPPPTLVCDPLGSTVMYLTTSAVTPPRVFIRNMCTPWETATARLWGLACFWNQAQVATTGTAVFVGLPHSFTVQPQRHTFGFNWRSHSRNPKFSAVWSSPQCSV